MFHPYKSIELLVEDLSLIDVSSEPRVGGVILDSLARNHHFRGPTFKRKKINVSPI